MPDEQTKTYQLAPTGDAPPAALLPAVPETKAMIIPIGPMGVQLQSLEDAYRFAKCVLTSKMAPKGFDTVESVVIAMILGLEVGLAPMQALQSIAVVNGRPTIFGDAALALVRSKGILEMYSQEIVGEGFGSKDKPEEEGMKAIVRVKRRDQEEIVSEFSMGDARRAGLYPAKEDAAWYKYPKRMLMWRARGFALRDGFGDVLKGLPTAEEAGDIIDVTPHTRTTVAAAEPAALPAPKKSRAKPAETTAPAASTTTPTKPEPKSEAKNDLPEEDEPGEDGMTQAEKDKILRAEFLAGVKERFPDNAEAAVKELMNADAITNVELGAELKAMQIRIPREFDEQGPGCLTDKTNQGMLDNGIWEMMRSRILKNRMP